MSEHAVASLYDALYDFESRLERADAYPVHKRLRFDDDGAGAGDIYDWIFERVDLPRGADILDAGCGVGFGTLRLAQRSAARVTGISLSEKELAAARRVAVHAGLAGTVEFARRSFDELPQATYDLVVAVESLKHSPDLAKSLRSLADSIRRGGQLVIVEDFPTGRLSGPAAERLQRDWGLARLYTENDYLAILGAQNCRCEDLTDRVRRRGRFVLGLKLALLAAWMPVTSRGRATALRAFRGGLHLERLYADRQMRYKALFCRFGEPAR